MYSYCSKNDERVEYSEEWWRILVSRFRATVACELTDKEQLRASTYCSFNEWNTRTANETAMLLSISSQTPILLCSIYVECMKERIV